MAEITYSRIFNELEAIPREWPSLPERPPLGTLTIREHEIGISTESSEYPVENIAGRVLISEDGQDRATMSFTAYRSRLADPTSQRPVIICFNGGPMSAAGGWNANELYNPRISQEKAALKDDPLEEVYLELVAAGKLEYEEIVHQDVIDFADIVYIDPIGTGYGRVLEGTDENHFYGVQKGARVATEFTKWAQQTFFNKKRVILAGSSYGAMQMTEMADMIAEEGDIELAGLISISGAYDYNHLIPNQNNPKHTALLGACNLPSYAWLAYHHAETHDLDNGYHRGYPAADYEGCYEDARDFAYQQYANAVLGGRDLKSWERHYLSKLTGLSSETLQRDNFAVPRSTFAAKLLSESGLIMSSVDAYYTYPRSTKFNIDPLLDALQAKRMGNVRDQFWMISQPPDEYLFNRSVYAQWPFDGEWQARTAKPAMQRLLTRLPDLPVIECNGESDLLSNKEIRSLFWANTLPEIGWKAQSVEAPFNGPYLKPEPRTVTRYNLNLMGHQPGIVPFGSSAFSLMVQSMIEKNSTPQDTAQKS